MSKQLASAAVTGATHTAFVNSYNDTSKGGGGGLVRTILRADNGVGAPRGGNTMDEF